MRRLLLFGCFAALAAARPDFRNAPWGMTQAQVRAKYLFNAEHGDLNDFIGDFKTVEPLLAERYGKPTSERAVSTSDSHQEESLGYLELDRATPAQILPSDKLVGLSVSEGHLKLYTQWAGARTRLLHALTGENGHIIHQVEYAQTDTPKSLRP